MIVNVESLNFVLLIGTKEAFCTKVQFVRIDHLLAYKLS